MNSRRTHKKNLIVSYKNLSDDLKVRFGELYPEGYKDYLQRFEKPNGDTIFVVPMETEDTMYMVKFDVVIDASYDDDDSGKDYYDEEVEKADEIVFAPLEEALEKEENGGKNRVDADLQHGSLEESLLSDKHKALKHSMGITGEELEAAFSDDADEDEYDSYDDDKPEEDDEDDEYEPTDEELMDIDSEIFKNAEIPPEELAKMSVDEKVTQAVSKAAREAQAGKGKTASKAKSTKKEKEPAKGKATRKK